jgi:Derlin-2/3
MNNNNQRGLNDIAGPESWYTSLPFVTKHWLTAVLITTVSCNLEVLPIMKLVWSFESIKNDFEIWRIVTPFLWIGGFGKEGFQTLISLFLLYQYSSQYERGGGFNTGGGGGTADYVYMLLFGMVMILITNALFVGGYVMAKTLAYYVLYIWSKHNPTANANIWGVPVPAIYLPFAILALNFCLGNNYMEYIHGYAVGHLYYFVADVVPKVYGKTYLETPLFILSKFGVGEYVPPAPRNGMDATGNNVRRQGGIAAPGRVNPPNDPASRSTGHSWGNGGQRLGR